MSVADSITNALSRFGRPMVLRRKTWVGNEATHEDVTVYGVTEGALSVELSDGQAGSGGLKATFSNAQIIAAGWPGPPDKLDEMIIDDGQVRTIMAVETKYLGTQVLVFVADLLALNYDRLIRLERLTLTPNNAGGFAQEWNEIAVVAASKVDLSGDEAVSLGYLSAQQVSRFRVPWAAELADLNPADRVIYPVDGGRIYNIQAVKELQLKVGLEIIATTEAD